MKKLYPHLPNFIHNLLITVYNILAYRKRYGGNYKKYFEKYKENKTLSLKELEQIQLERLKTFVANSKQNSDFYRTKFSDIGTITSLKDVKKLPILKKEDLRKNINTIYTINKEKANISKTGGTTGKSLTVRFTKDNTQERFAMLDVFRSSFGYKLGKKTAWFSGKSILTQNDIKKNRFWKTDYYYKVRYYSTFHINKKSIPFYITNLIKFKPKFLVGFPSNMYEIAKFGINNNIDFPSNTIKAIFPTAETITPDSKKAIEQFFKTKMYNQYASSEGAPFIFECKQGKLHFELQSGIFEVLDENDNETNEGRLIVTPFATEGTPLIRYDIGDNIELLDGTCTCGNNNPLVKTILGRSDDFIYSKETGKINLGNISNTLKDTEGIVKFQVVQNILDEITILLIVDNKDYTEKTEKIFLKNWRDRVGYKLQIKLKYVNTIPVEKSGKYRMVKNNIKHLLND
ncbi:MAG: phenylacetate--CoA ligase family protein [Flavobacteriaceae bacterium]|nr:phenylacetate--CoA ligase family protein [Flavobacteriaceae bacterium]